MVPLINVTVIALSSFLPSAFDQSSLTGQGHGKTTTTLSIMFDHLGPPSLCCQSGTVSQVLLYNQAVQHMILCLGDHVELRKID